LKVYLPAVAILPVTLPAEYFIPLGRPVTVTFGSGKPVTFTVRLKLPVRCGFVVVPVTVMLGGPLTINVTVFVTFAVPSVAVNVTSVESATVGRPLIVATPFTDLSVNPAGSAVDVIVASGSAADTVNELETPALVVNEAGVDAANPRLRKVNV